MRYKIVKLLILVIGIEASLVMIGWIFGIDQLTGILPGGINMKFSTAVAFFLSAIGLYFIFRRTVYHCELSQVVLPGIALLIFLIMGTLLMARIFNVQTGIENLFTQVNTDINTTGSGWPSLFAMVNFILFGVVCLFCLFTWSGYQAMLKLFGYTIAIVGLVAVIGYILVWPLLYYQFIASMVPMALNTALTFVLLGASLIMISQIITGNET